MENRILEQLFKDKLGGMVIEPSTTAKDVFSKKIGLIKQRILIRRISIAASIFLLAMAGIYAFLPNRVDKIDLAHDDPFMEQPENIAEDSEIPVPIISSERESMIADGEVVSDVDEKRNVSDVDEKRNIRQQSVAMSGGTIQEDTDLEKGLAHDESLAEIEEADIRVDQTSETEKLVADRSDEGVYIEYAIEDPEGSDQLQEKQYEPVKITIEYIASGKNPAVGRASKEKTEADRKKFYSKLDNMKSVDEVLGDIRTYKDRLFALDFKKDNKVNDEDKLEE